MPSSFSRRVVETARLRPVAYEEVEADTRERTWWQPGLVVLISSLGMATAQFGRLSPSLAFYSALWGIVGWIFWSGLVYIIGARLLPATSTYATWGQLLRTAGFAAGPGILGFLGVFRSLTGITFAVLGLWIVVAEVIAVRQALDYSSTLRALGVCALGWGVCFVLAWTLAG